ncbi:chromosomal replication initiator protein DnaA [Candidatus Woesebacteria bacterium RBG_13_34_9]|uniref:Chromosomal replication initiator protein DnaA n=1 Tax=Candidatus Woesebacteria bacterium RBG_13_34_9 TaxID=1802477 RepID=A0A1F7X3B6_9BACT|nr:MAG: chromosomal replication initiator protein DnaA [Candidatus Woesebacteria bacterium RBG_13_34_9]
MQEDNLKNIWSEVLDTIKVSISPANFTTWFSQTHLSSIKKTNNRYSAEVGCISSFIKTTIESRYFGLIQDTLSKTLNSPCDIFFVIKDSPYLNLSDKIEPLFDSSLKDQKTTLQSSSKVGLRPGFIFSNFAVSSSNQMAWAAAEAVSKDPGKAYNPLFIWGGVGVGKTHLMNAIGYKIIEDNIDANIFFCTGEHFTNDIVEGIRNKTTSTIRNKYRKLSALFVDDIQFIAGKDAIQEEFFHTFNALVSFGGQVVLTSDRPPSEISKLEERLRSRFEAGLIVDISPPDFELRCAIVQIKLKEKGLELDSDIVQLIAGNLESARKIEGFLIRLMSEVQIKKTLISSELVETLIGKGLSNNNNVRKKDPPELLDAVSKYYSLGKRLLLGSSRSRPIARPRQILMYLLRTELGMPLEEVGKFVGNRDHTTVMHAVDKITHLASDNVNIREDIRGIKSLI